MVIFGFMPDRLEEITKKSPPQFFGIPYLESLAKLDTGFCLPGSMKMGSEIVPIITIHVPDFGLDYFGIKKKPFEMDHRFRYLDLFRDELIQICIHLKKDRQLILNLDPLSAIVREFLKMTLKTELYGFFFLCRKKSLFICNFTEPDDEEKGWLTRNLKRAKKLRRNNVEEVRMQAMLQNEITGNRENKFYIGEDWAKDECFISDKTKLLPFMKVSEYLF